MLLKTALSDVSVSYIMRSQYMSIKRAGWLITSFNCHKLSGQSNYRFSRHVSISLSLPLSLFISSLLLLQSIPSSVYVSRSLEQPLLACRFFSSPLPALGRSLPSAVALARWYSTDPAASFPLSSPTSVPRTRTPLQKTQVQCGRNGGFLPSFPFTLFPSFLLYLSLNLFPSLPLAPAVPVSFFHPRPFSSVSLSRAVLYLRFVRSESVALSHFIMYLKIASRSHPSTSDSQPSLEHRWLRDCAFFVELEKSSFVLDRNEFFFFFEFSSISFRINRQKLRISIIIKLNFIFHTLVSFDIYCFHISSYFARFYYSSVIQ